MELILKEDVQNLGFKDDIVNVKNGYGRNFLIPNGKAVIATSSARKVLAENLKQRAHKEQKLIDDANKIAKKLQGFEIKIKSKVGSGDKLFGSIGSQDVADAFESNGQAIDKKFITLPGKTIKRLGAYEATVRIHRAVVVQVAFEIIAE
ncbi:50S ribosomal protein L9 [Flavobacteriaceae bacterium]|jgi:large subunit ribosomal protein L9|nr:50S ribosomal protein L9 [Flavobacteriaceae bacterium]MDB2325552.1 50S ribosomal protein L9 [Flavobacteriaceae bacterium]MDB2329913.1 50S ribosomal protein L9 [Flavobacteriaceae bacterium]MDB2456803.1 50S ribosomal protein L9 [Flavobacteriaceae bacterium]MDB4643664.1 50S ribosomal protein L9 [Flavobacteriaceae bacterium]